jgi:hypothetical protein
MGTDKYKNEAEPLRRQEHPARNYRSRSRVWKTVCIPSETQGLQAQRNASLALPLIRGFWLGVLHSAKTAWLLWLQSLL